MPQVDLKFSNNINLDVSLIFKSIELIINDVDASAGACKSRAYPAPNFQHTHALISIGLLRKSHRDERFMQDLLDRLKIELSDFIPEECYYAIDLSFLGNHYFTTKKN